MPKSLPRFHIPFTLSKGLSKKSLSKNHFEENETYERNLAWIKHYEKIGCFATRLVIRFFNCNNHL
jgi:hypothetical protein